MEPITIIAALALVLVVFFVIKKKDKKKYKDIDLPIPDTRRSDLLYGYYSSLDRTFDQVKDHVNLFWYSNFFGRDNLIEIMKSTDNMRFVVDLAPMVQRKEGGKGVLLETAEQELKIFFDTLKENGVLHKVTYLYPVDEPNLFVKSAEEHKKMIQAVQNVRMQYKELNSAKLACIYGRGKPFWNIEMYNVVGVDDYDQKSEVLTIGEHARLLKEKGWDQTTFLVPGAAFGQNPSPFVAYALLNPTEVEAVVPFIWFDDPGHKDVPYTGLEAQSEEQQAIWRQAGNICLNKE